MASGSHVNFPTLEEDDNNVPFHISYPGQYGFEMGFWKQPKDSNSLTWVYSDSLRKLYVSLGSICPIAFRTTLPPPEGSIIRALPMYSEFQHVQEVMRRCPNHTFLTGADEQPEEVYHILKCEHRLSQYVEDQYTGRLSVTLPFESSTIGCEGITNFFQFMCYSSCTGSINRRPFQVIFTLECQGQILGRKAIHVRVCASPCRDQVSEESKSQESTQQVSIEPLKTSNKKKRKLSTTSEEEYTLKIKGKETYNILSKLRDSLEITNCEGCKHTTSCPGTPTSK